MPKRQGRILVVDDRQEWLDAIANTLKSDNYYVGKAASLDEAHKMLSQDIFHLVILDIHMEGVNGSNKGGLDLLVEMKKKQFSKAIKFIMITDTVEKQDMRMAFKEEIVDFLDKGEYADDALLKMMQTIFEAEHMKHNLFLDITWHRDTKVEQVILNVEIDGMRIKRDTPLHELMTLELDDLLCRLFYDAKSVHIRQLTPGYSGTNVLIARPVYEEGAARPVIIKFGDRQKIEDEHARFERYAERYIGGGHFTTTLAIGRTPRLAGIVYSLVGVAQERQEDFGTFYRRASEQQVKKVLQQLFESTCGNWYDDPGTRNMLNLTNEYPKKLNFTWEQLHQTLADSLKSVQGKEQLTFMSLNSSRKFTNPILAAEGQSLVYPTYTCITHGDFNQNNILVDNDLHTWLIDFQETGPGHILRDITALDTEIRCKMLWPDEVTLKDLLKMEEALCSVDTFGQLDRLETAFPTSNSALAKTYATIVGIRLLASKLIPHHQEDSMSEYYTALLYHALNTSRFRSLSTGQREHALLSASLLVDKLGLKG